MMTGMARSMGVSLAAAVSLMLAMPAHAQQHEPEHETTAETAKDMVAPSGQHDATGNQIDIAHHIGNSHQIETPFGIIHLPDNWKIPLGTTSQGQARYLDISPTKHLVFLVLSAVLVTLVMLLSARSVTRAQANGRPPRGFAGAMEAMVLWVRQEVVLPNVGHHGEGFAPFLLTIFFFVLTMNLLGLLPWGATATSNISVTAALAIMAFFVIEITGMRTLGFRGYMKTIFYLPPGLPGGPGGAALKVLLLVVMTPIELIGKLAKPFALAVRLFANMTSGHVLVLALLGLTFLFRSYFVGVGASLLATGVMVLEVFVAFLQAFVFTLLTAVFIGLMRAEH
jgi:F-type H+-transporting ATPase subunit a